MEVLLVDHMGSDLSVVNAARVKELEFNCAELAKENSEMSERVKKLASRQPSWPKGYRPQRRYNNRER